MRCLSQERRKYRRPKRVLQEKEVELQLEEDLQEVSSKFLRKQGCSGHEGYCPATAGLENESILREFAIRSALSKVQVASRLSQELRISSQEMYEDTRGIGHEIACCGLDDAEVPYRVPEVSSRDILERFGMHITSDPGFSYSEPRLPYTQA